jgi:hypothetical protein
MFRPLTELHDGVCPHALLRRDIAKGLWVEVWGAAK